MDSLVSSLVEDVSILSWSPRSSCKQRQVSYSTLNLCFDNVPVQLKMTSGIAAGVASIAGSAAATAAVVTLTSSAVVTTIFGVGGGSLAAYKMQRRTQGLTEFEFRKETNGRQGETKSDIDAELFS